MVLGRVGMHTTTRLDELRTEEHELAVLSGRVAQADQAALPALYDRTSARVYGLALRILRDQSAAEEVALDVHLQVHRQASRFDPARGHALAWLLTLARTRAIDRLRVESFLTQRVDLFVFVSPADVQAAYETEADRFKGQSPEAAERIIEEELVRQKSAQRRRDYVAQLRSRATIRQLADVPDGLPARP